MPGLTLLFGLILIGQGLLAYFVLAAPNEEGRISITALIPAFLGAALVLLGLMAMNKGMRKHAMHLAMLLGLLGIVGALYRPVTGMTSGGDVAWTSTPVLMQLTMAVICLVYLFLGVRSFINARRKKS